MYTPPIFRSLGPPKLKHVPHVNVVVTSATAGMVDVLISFQNSFVALFLSLLSYDDELSSSELFSLRCPYRPRTGSEVVAEMRNDLADPITVLSCCIRPTSLQT